MYKPLSGNPALAKMMIHNLEVLHLAESTIAISNKSGFCSNFPMTKELIVSYSILKHILLFKVLSRNWSPTRRYQPIYSDSVELVYTFPALKGNWFRLLLRWRVINSQNSNFLSKIILIEFVDKCNLVVSGVGGVKIRIS